MTSQILSARAASARTNFDSDIRRAAFFKCGHVGQSGLQAPGELVMAFAAWIADAVGFARDRPRRVAVTAGAFLAIVVAAWWLVSQRGAPALLRVDRTAASPQAPDLQVAVPPPMPAQKGVERCSSEAIPVVDGNPHLALDMEAAMLAADSAIGSLATDLAARSTDRERALGLYLQMVAAWAQARGNCGGEDVACGATVESRGALVRLATTTSDADAYALAIFSCAPPFGHTANGDCGSLSYGQWARIEPDNAVPWLYLAGEAEGHRDQNAAEEALYRASKARYSDPHLDQISGLVASDAMATLSPTVQIDLAGSLFSIQGGLPHPNLSVVMHYCGISVQSDPNRVETCGDLAATLIERSRTAVEVLIGGRIAERVGWTDPRLVALRDEADAMRWRLSSMGTWRISQQESMLSSCDSLQRLRRNMVAQAQLGESGRLRQEIGASGLTTAQAAKQWRIFGRRR